MKFFKEKNMDEVEKLREALDEAKKLKQVFIEKNGATSTRIANKDILFWLITEKFRQDNKINILTAKFKYLEKVFYGTIFSTILLLIGVVVT